MRNSVSVVTFIVFCFGFSQSVHFEKQEDAWTDLLTWYRNLRKAGSGDEGVESSRKIEVDDERDFSGEWDYVDDGSVVTAEGRKWNEREKLSSLDHQILWNDLVKHRMSYESPQKFLTFEDDEKAVRGSSLAFVFDSTGSMGDELNHVKSGAMKILAALRDHPNAPIYNYIWVPFNDPSIGPITMTRDPKLFEERMNDVVATGGGDCPEMSLEAIRMALDTSLPHSYVYVFTDAPPKDSNLLNEVLSLVQRKQAQVVFIITDGCLSTENENYWVYERIAHTSSGQIYKLTTDEVKEVLKYVKVALQPDIVSLVSLNKPASNKTQPDKINVIIDDSLEQFTISVSGTNAKINVSDPKGIPVYGPPLLEKVLNLANVKVVKVKEPDPGAWSVLINSDSNYTVRSTGLSKLNFNHGFSTKESPDLKETNYRPLKGAKSFVLVQTTDAEEVFNITTLDFIGLSGTVLKSIPLESVEEKRGLYKAGSFIPPNEFFYLQVSGFGKDGMPIKRITSTAISAQLPEKPVVIMKSKVVGRVNHSGKIGCRVESVVPTTIRWYKNGKYLEKEQICSETCEVNLQFDKYLPETEGKYLCHAKNIAGTNSKELFLSITGHPPVVAVNSPVIASLGQKVLLNCSVQSELPFNLTWAQFTATNLHSGVLHPSSAGIKLDSNSLLIEKVKAEDEGWYVCTAKNNAGESQERVLLVIKEPVTVKVRPEVVVFSKGDSARVFCSASGKPQPRIEWTKNQQPIKDPSIVIEDIKDNKNFVIDYLEEKHAGNYTCNAINIEESASASVIFLYKESPKVKAKENNLIVKNGSPTVMTCMATGIPKPVIKWYKDGKELDDSNQRIEITEKALIIKTSDVSDFGEYSCVAENDQGTSVDYIGLTIGSEPTFLQKPRTREIQLNHSGTVSCSAFGVPLPKIKWTRKDGREVNKTRIFLLPTGALKITKMEYEDGGRYVCTAENVFGSISHEVSIKALGAAPPTLDVVNHHPSEIIAVRNKELIIPCGVLLGNPPARVSWYKNGVRLQEGELGFSADSKTLTIANVTLNAGGSYLCEAVNALGQSSRSIDVFISESPTIANTNITELKGSMGGVVIIPCPAEGRPAPTISWKKNGLPLLISATTFQNEIGSLIIRNLSKENSGTYVCTATNAAGSVSKETLIQVQVPPSFADEMEDYPVNVVEGHMVVLNCNAYATPEPIVKWYKDGDPFINSDNQTKILRFFATVNHTGNFKCIVSNEAGSNSREFNVTILVPPKILGQENEKSIQAKTGISITITCNVTGIPTPTILWQRNGMYLTQNTTDEIITKEGSLIITNVTKKSAGAYTCDAENLGGITQRTYYLQINYPPSFLNVGNKTTSIILKEGTKDYSLYCLVEGSPQPSIIWKKNGFPVDKNQSGLSILKDNSLVFIQVEKEMAGTYRCEVFNSQGFAFKEFDVKVMVPPSVSYDFNPTKLEVNEGDTLVLTCPTMLDMPPANIQWIKDGKQLDLLFQERSDEAQMKLSPDQKTLVIVEAHPVDRGNYSCVATYAAGRTDAKFFVDVLMTPHFEEFNHVARRTILTGGEVVLNCSVSGNPQPKVFWRKENTSITPHKIPGVHVTLDKRHLKIINGQVNHTGTYVCLATNKVNTKEREFYVTVLEPPQISGSLHQKIQVFKGDNLILNCQSTGNPDPTFVWIKQTDTKAVLNFTKDTLEINNIECEEGGMYICQVKNVAGTRTKYFDVEVLKRAEIKNQSFRLEKMGTVDVGNATTKCKAVNHKFEKLKVRKGRAIRRKLKKASDKANDFDGFVILEFVDSENHDSDVRNVFAFKASGTIEKKFEVHVSAPSKQIMENETDVESVFVFPSDPIILRCPFSGEPTPVIKWHFDDRDLKQNVSDQTLLISGNELRIKKTNFNHSGIYVCLAENPKGNLTHSFNLSVIESSKVNKMNEYRKVRAGETLELHCNASGLRILSYKWSYFGSPYRNDINAELSKDGKTLTIKHIKKNHSGKYTCLAIGKPGVAEIYFHVSVIKVNSMSDENFKMTVRLNEPFTLSCLRFGDPPPPRVTWYKDGKKFEGKKSNGSLSIFGNFYLKISNALLEDGGHYKCIAGKGFNKKELNFYVDVAVPGLWNHWSEWSSCSVSCGSGYQTRTRICEFKNNVSDSKLKTEQNNCFGDEIEKKNCVELCQNSKPLEWSFCSNVCGLKIHKKCEFSKHYLTEHLNSTKCEEVCSEKNCPIDGQWSQWSDWSSCTHSGIMRRIRLCNSPLPQNGGENCWGRKREIKLCNESICREPGVWLPWSEWSSCSLISGSIRRKRMRKCHPSKCGRLCTGSNHQFQECLLEGGLSKKAPSSADVQITGKVNGRSFDEKIDVKFTNLKDESKISTNLSPKLQEQNWFPYTPFLFFPLSWNSAHERDDADNGLSLTGGNFFSESDVRFSTGEEIRVKHKGEGINKNGTFLVEIEVVGEVPMVQPQAIVAINSVEQDLVQTGPNTLYALTRNNMTVKNPDFFYLWNNTIKYIADNKVMPYLVEKLTLKNMSNTYDPRNKNIKFTAYSSIEKKFSEKKCPSGFVPDLKFMHCQDIDECDTQEFLCESDKICENTFGSYKCVCRIGFKMTEGRCLDIDECSQGSKVCSHFCHNTPGSYECSCPYGYYLEENRRNCLELSNLFNAPLQEKRGEKSLNFSQSNEYFDTNAQGKYQEHHASKQISFRMCPNGYFYKNNECKDYNECENFQNSCDVDETCVNFPGSFKCMSTPCPVGYDRIKSNGHCVKICSTSKKCTRGATVSESIIFYSVALNRTHVLPLDKVGIPDCNVVKTRYRLGNSSNMFQIKQSENRYFLLPKPKLKKNVLYRVEVEAFSYGPKTELLYFTKLILFLILN